MANQLEISLDEIVLGLSNEKSKPIQLSPEILVEGKSEIIIKRKIQGENHG